MKKYTAFLLAAALLLLCACGSAPAAPEQTSVPAAETAAPADGTAAPAAETSAPGNDAPDTAAQPGQTPAPAPSETPQASEEPEETAAPGNTDVTAEAPASPEVPGAETASPAENTPAPTPAPNGTPEPTPAAPGETAAAAEPDAPYAVKTADTVLTVKGSALTREWYFTLAELQSLGGYVEADYFSRGKDPQELTQTFAGIDMQYLLGTIVGCTDYKKAVFSAGDGYNYKCSRGAVGMTYINEMVPDAALKMILAWTEDGSPCGLRLVMGQQSAGEYNRTYWVRNVCEIELRAE